MDNNTANPEAVKTEKNDTSKNATSQTNEGQTADVVKKEGDVDYKAELEALQSQTEIDKKKSDEIIGHKNRAIEALKKKLENDGVYDPAQIEEIIKSEITEKVNQVMTEKSQEFDSLKQDLIQDVIDDEVNNFAKSTDEAELMKFHLNNSLKFGNSKAAIRKAVKTAKLMANEKNILSTNKELAQALMSKATVNTSPNTAGEKSSTSENPEYSKAEKAFLGKYDVKV
jgi:uncharacterized protein (UPF0333 family)